jgi:signal transduction histidine kinase
MIFYRFKYITVFLLLVQNAFCGTGLMAVEKPITVGKQETVELSIFPEYLIDESHTLALGDVVKARFHKASNRNPSFGWTRDTVWLKIVLNLTNNEQRYLEIGYPLLDYIDVYILKDGIFQQKIELGDRQSIRTRLAGSIKPAVKFPGGEGVYTLFLRVTSESSLQIPVMLYSEKAYYREVLKEVQTLSAYFGIIGVMIIYNFLLFTTVRNNAYIYYVGFIASLLLIQLATSGYGQVYVWPEWMSGHASGRLPLLTGILAALFSDSYLNLYPKNKRLHRMMQLVMGVLGASFVATLFLDYENSARLMSVCIIATVVLLLIVATIVAVRDKDRQAKLYLVAWSMLLIGGFIYVFKQLGFMPYNFFTHNALLIGSIMEVILLSLALGDRYSTYQKIARLAEAKKAELQQQLRVELENRVSLVSELAHRMNNPLNYLACSLPLIEKEIHTHSNEVTQIIMDSTDDYHEAETLISHLKSRIMEVISFISVAKLGVKRCAHSIAEIRSLSGVNGYEISQVRLSDALQRAVLRFEEDNQEAGAKISVASRDFDDVSVCTNAYAFEIAMKKIFGEWAASVRGDLNIVVSSCRHYDDRRQVFVIECDNPGVKEGGVECIGRLDQILKPYGTTVFAEDTRTVFYLPLLRHPGSELNQKRELLPNAA